MFLRRAMWVLAFGAVACSSAPPPPPPPPPVRPPAPPAPLACAAGQADCDGDRANGCEARLDADTACGACGHACAEGEGCVTGTCRRTNVLVAGGQLTCAAPPGKELRCWGANHAGEIGDGTLAPRARATKVPGIDGARSIAVDDGLTCAVAKSGVSCWGGAAVTKAPRHVDGFDDVTAVGIQSGVVWLLRGTGKITRGAATEAGLEVVEEAMPGVTDAVALSVAEYHGCALLASGGVACWGDDELVGAGDAAPAPRDEGDERAPSHEAARVAGLTDAVQISASVFHTCAVRRSGHIACWGKSFAGELGDGDRADQRTPVEVKGVEDAVEVASGHAHTCALRRSGEVACWGSGTQGQLGDGRFRSSDEPVLVKDLGGAIHVAAGDETSCAMLKSGEIRCWGSNARGRLGVGSMAEAVLPVAVPGVASATQIGVGAGYACARLADGTMTCWGRGFDDHRDRPAGKPAAVAGIDHAVSLDTGFFRACAANAAGKLACWSAAGSAEAGGTTRTRSAEIVPTLAGVKSGIDGLWAGIVLGAAGQASLWHIEPAPPKAAPPARATTLPLGIANATAVVGEDSSLCALAKTGKVSCVRYDPFRSFDKKKPVRPGAPVVVDGLDDAVQIAQNASAYCAVRKSGKVACWSTSWLPRPGGAPTKLTRKGEPLLDARDQDGVEGAVEVAVGSGFRCAVASGAALCWGSNQRGELGVGDLVAHAGVTKVIGLTDAVHVAAHGDTACAVRKDGGVVCWGDGSSGQLGQENVAAAGVPMSVLAQ